MQLAAWYLIRFRSSGRDYHVYCRGNEHPSPLHHPITGAHVRMVIGHWLTWEFDEALHWIHMVWFYQEYALTPICAQELTRDLFGEWLVDQITSQRLRLYEELPPMRPGQSFEEYARIAHVPVVAAKAESTLPPAANPTIKNPYHVVSAPGGMALANKYSAECPHPNFRSERIATVTAEVLAWLKQHVPPDRWAGELGEKGGGGFLATSTRVMPIMKGAVVYRYYGGTAKALSTWWFPSPFEGDPRVFAALPEGSSASHLVKARAKVNLTILVGIGAPRCSNKPGGPLQYLFPYQPSRKIPTAWNDVGLSEENDYLELI